MSGLVGMSLTYSLEVSTLAKLGCGKKKKGSKICLAPNVRLPSSVDSSARLVRFGRHGFECEDHFFACK